ncbi:MAG: SOS response regulatory protein OraA/RecX [Alteromonadaceae bacterium]|jgi:SOS response regulatory protein OraA/RecX
MENSRYYKHVLSNREYSAYEIYQKLVSRGYEQVAVTPVVEHC